MISKDSDYLNNKLRQLKTSVLNKQQLESSDLPKHEHFPQSQKFISTINQRENAYDEQRSQGRSIYMSPQVQNSQSYHIGPTVIAHQYDRQSYLAPQMQTNGNMTPSLNSDQKRPMSTQVIDNLKQTDTTFANLRGNPVTNGSTIHINDSRIINTMDPKVKTVYASNSKSFINNANDLYSDYKRSEINSGPVYHTNDLQNANTHYTIKETPNFIRQSEISPMKMNSHLPTQTVYRPNYGQTVQPDSDVLKSINNQSFLEKHEHKILNEMQQKLANQIDKNNKIGEDIMNLRRVFETERQKLAHLDEQLRDEYKHIKINENEAINSTQNLDHNLSELHQKSKFEDERHNKMQSDLERIQAENEMLRGELKRLGEITSEKILDLENNINSVARMKEFENENFMMEKEKVSNSADFVIEQMKVHFNERNSKIEEQMRKLQLDKDKLSTELRAVTEDIKMFNFNADQKINNSMNIIIQEEQEKHQFEVKEIESKIRVEEEELARINRRNQDLINKFQTVEREGKNRIMAKKNENTRLKEDLSNFEQNYNKLLIQVSNENRDYEKKKETIEVLKEDYEDVQNKSQMLDQRYDEEMHNIQVGHEENLSELERDYNIQKDKEQRLLQLIREENDKIFELQKKHSELIDDIQRGFNSTFQNQFGKMQKN